MAIKLLTHCRQLAETNLESIEVSQIYQTKIKELETKFKKKLEGYALRKVEKFVNLRLKYEPQSNEEMKVKL